MARITIDNIDLLDISIGKFGYWQVKMAILLLLINILIASVTIGDLFMVPPFELWCKSNDNFKNVLFKERLPCFIDDVDGSVSNTTVYSKSVCDKISIHETLLSEWNLSKQREEFTENAQILVIIGTALGGILFGRFADVFGRKFSFIILTLLQTLCSIVSAIGDSYYAFLALKFISGMVNAGIFVSSLVLCVEVVSKKYRTYIPALYQLIFGIVSIVFAGIGCCMYKWREFQLLLAGVNILFLCYFWFLDESPRWLVVNDFNEEVITILERASKPQNIHQQIVDEMCLAYKEEETSLGSVLNHNHLKHRTLFLCVIWLILGTLWESLFGFVGEAFNNPYNYVLIHGIVLLISSVLLIIAGYLCGRQLQGGAGAYFVTLCFCGLWVIPVGNYENWASFVFSILGFLGLNVAIPSTFLFTSELYPTVLRCTGVGLTITFFYLGFAVVSLIHLIGGLSWVLPLIVLACLAVAHCYLQIFLPETKNAVLPNVLSDIINEEVE